MTKPKLLLIHSINPSIFSDSEDYKKGMSIAPGLTIVKKIFDKKGFETEILNLNFQYLEENISKKNFYNDTLKLILGKEPDYIGFNTFGPSYHVTLRLTERIKEEYPEVTIFLGNQQATSTDKETLRQYNSVDIICRGEAEKSVQKLADQFKGKEKIENIPGITFRDNSGNIKRNQAEIVKGKNILTVRSEKNKLIEKYEGVIDNILHIEGTRGCPFNCTFCSTKVHWDKYRVKPVDILIDEIKENVERTGINTVEILGDLFTADKEYLLDFCNKISKTEVEWICFGKTTLLDKETIDILDESGCHSLLFGIESGDDSILRRIKKETTSEINDEIINYIPEETNIRPKCTFIIGFPYETEENINNTLEKIIDYYSLGSEIILYTIEPLRETELYENYKKDLITNNTLLDEREDIVLIDEKDKETIKRNKRLFSYCYRFGMENMSIYHMLGLKRIFSHLLFNYPNTLVKYHKKYSDNTVVDLLKKILCIEDAEVTESQLTMLLNHDFRDKLVNNFFNKQINKELKITFINEKYGLLEKEEVGGEFCYQ